MSHYSIKSCKSRTEAMHNVRTTNCHLRGSEQRNWAQRSSKEDKDNTIMHAYSSCCGWQMACLRTKRQQTLKKSGLQPFRVSKTPGNLPKYNCKYSTVSRGCTPRPLKFMAYSTIIYKCPFPLYAGLESSLNKPP